jgi:hypothetical protein
VLTDRGSCFVADAFEAACRRLKVEHRTTRPYTPRTNGMVERFTGRVQREVLGITIHSHRDLETLLHGFNHACNARRQRVLGGVSPDEAVRRRLQSNPRLNSRRDEPPSDPCVPPKTLMIVEAAKDVSHPDNLDGDVDLVAVVRTLLSEQTRRRESGRADWLIPFRPDHGHVLLHDAERPTHPGYTLIGRLKGLAELRGVMSALSHP